MPRGTVAASGGRARSYGDDALDVQVDDQGPPGHGRAAQPGNGITGMTERARALGGRCELAAAAADSGCRVAAQLGNAGRRPGGTPGTSRRPAVGRRQDAVIRVGLADDQKLVRTGFAALLDAEDDMEMAGQAANGEEAVGLAGASGRTCSSWISGCRCWTASRRPGGSRAGRNWPGCTWSS